MRSSLALLIVVGVLLIAGRTNRPAEAQPAPLSPFRAGEVDSPLFDVRLVPEQTEPPQRPCLPTQLEQMAFQARFELLNGVPRLWLGEAAAGQPGEADRAVALSVDGDGFRMGETTIILASRAGFFEELTLTGGRIVFEDADGDRVGDRFRVETLDVKYLRVTGSIALNCTVRVTASGVPDRTAPAVSFAAGCDRLSASERERGPESEPPLGSCLLLADSAVVLTFSEPVRTADLAMAVRATTADGSTIPLRRLGDEPALAIAVQRLGPWPLGSVVAVTVAAGIHDRNGNASTRSSSLRFPVVAGPRLLDNEGFEQGDLRNYTVHTLRDYHQPFPGVIDEAVFPAQTIGEDRRDVFVVMNNLGITPPQGEYMFQANRSGSLSGGSRCSIGEVSLTARFTLPSAASHVALAYQFVTPRDEYTSLRDSRPSPSGQRWYERNPILAGSTRVGERLAVARVERPARDEVVALEGASRTGLVTTGWRRFLVPVNGREGEEVVLTLRLRPELASLPPVFCSVGLLLLDNIHLVQLEESAP